MLTAVVVMLAPTTLSPKLMARMLPGMFRGNVVMFHDQARVTRSVAPDVTSEPKAPLDYSDR